MLKKLLTPLLISLTMLTQVSFAAAPYYWQVNSIQSFSGVSTYDQNATASPLTLLLTNCSGGIQKPHNLTTYNVTWYVNTVNSTVGGTEVSSEVKSTEANFQPSIQFIPSTATVGTFYYYAVLSNPSMTTCGFTTTLTSPVAKVTVNSLVIPTTLSYNVGGASTSADFPAGGMEINVTNLSTCQASVKAIFWCAGYGNGNWTNDPYDYYVNGNKIGSGSGLGTDTFDLSAFMPVTSVKMVKTTSSNWNQGNVRVLVGSLSSNVAPEVLSPIVFALNEVVSPLTATLSGTGTSLKWYDSEIGNGLTNVAPTPNTSAYDTNSYFVSQIDINGCESERAKIETRVNPSILSYNVGGASTSADFPAGGMEINVTNLSTCQASVKAIFWCAGYGNGNWTNDPYDYYVNGNKIGSGSGLGTDTFDLSAFMPVTSVKMVKTSASNWNQGNVRVLVGSPSINHSPFVETPLVYILNQEASPLSAELSGTGSALKWFTSVIGDGFTANAPTPATSAIDTIAYFVSQIDVNGCESKRASLDVIVKPTILSYNVGGASTAADFPVDGMEINVTDLSTCQNGAKAIFWCAGYGNGNWTNDPYDYYVNGNKIGSGSGLGVDTFDLSAYLPVSSVKMVKTSASNWNQGSVTVKVSSTSVNHAPIVSDVIYNLDATATPLTATLSGTGTSLKWYTSANGDNYSSEAKVPSTNVVGVTDFFVSQSDVNGCESARAKVSVEVKMPTGTESNEVVNSKIEVSRFNFQGQEVNKNFRGLIIIRYNDGSVIKTIQD